MGSKLECIEPQKVFGFFEDITKIPRGSGNEKAISDYLVDFADKRGLIAYQDALNNITMIKPATNGMEDKETVILQAHMDMVCVKDPGADTDPAKDPIDLIVDGDYIKANGTSLGADDGIGIALILAVLDSDDISHPMIEAIFTADEEDALTGANGYDISRVKGKRFINVDTEEENHIVIGCAGGCRCEVTQKCKNGKVEGNIYEIGISGLTGGHSGTSIDKGLANANVLMGRLLLLAKQSVDLELGAYEGGSKENAIAQSASATVVIGKKNGKAFEKCVKSFCESVLAEYGKTDPGFMIKCKDKGKGKLKVMSTKDMNRFVALLNVLPNGVVKMSQTVDMVETSANIGVASAVPESFRICVSLRSNRDAALDWMISKVGMIATAFKASFEARGRYQAWEPSESDLAKNAKELYEKMFGKNIDIVTIHAGLECAVFSEKIKGIDAISIGPDIEDAHSTSERLSISSTKREWDYLLGLLKL